MATPVIDASGLTTIDTAESVAQWGGDTFSLEPDDKKEGSNSVACAQTNNGSNDVYVDIAAGSWNIDGSHLRLWFKQTYNGYVQTQALDGIQVFVSDGSNTDYFTVLGSDTYPGGWYNIVLVCDATRFPTVTRTAITQVGIRINTHSKPRNVPANAWFDYWKFGDGIIVTGGTSGDPIDMDLIAAEDALNGYGIVESVSGVDLLTGEVLIGDGVTATYYKDDNKVIVFKDEIVAPALYKLLFQGSGCEVELLDTQYRADGSASFVLDCDDGSLLSLNVDGCGITKANSTLFKGGQTAKNSVWNQCGMVNPSAATFEFNTVKNSTETGASTGALYLPLVNDVNSISFSGNDRDVYIDQAGTFNGVAFTHDGTSTYEIDYNNAADSTFNVPSGGNTTQGGVFNSGAGSLTVAATSTKTITGLPVGVEGRVVRGAYTMHYEDNILDEDFVYSYTPDNRKVLMRFTLGGYLIEPIELTLDSIDQVIPATVKPDPSYI